MERKQTWRPPNWDKINPIPIGKSMSFAFNREELYKHGERCTDAILEALFKLAKESPTGTFTIDSRIVNIYEEDLEDENKRDRVR